MYQSAIVPRSGHGMTFQWQRGSNLGHIWPNKTGLSVPCSQSWTAARAPPFHHRGWSLYIASCHAIGCCYGSTEPIDGVDNLEWDTEALETSPLVGYDNRKDAGDGRHEGRIVWCLLLKEPWEWRLRVCKPRSQRGRTNRWSEQAGSGPRDPAVCLVEAAWLCESLDQWLTFRPPVSTRDIQQGRQIAYRQIGLRIWPPSHAFALLISPRNWLFHL